MIKPSNRFKFLFWFFITLTDTIIQNHNNLHNHHHHQQHHLHLNHQNNSTDSEDSKMQTDHNGGSNGGQQLQYITLGNNIPATSATTPTSDSKGANNNGGPKTWTPSDMESALEALRSHNMSLTKASATYGIPSTTLWQRAHRLGIGEF